MNHLQDSFKFFNKIAIIFLVNLSMQALATQNVSELILNTDSKLDTCCTTISSQIDQLTVVFENSIAATFTTVNAIVTEIIDLAESFTGLTALGLCDATPLIIGNSGATISTPGVYCLASDADLQGNSIVISANNVIFDLNGHTISGSSNAGIIQLSATSFVAIQNGTIVGTANSARGIIYPSGNISNLTIRNLTLSNGGTAISLASTANSLLQNVYINNFNNFGTGISIYGTLINITLDNCIVDSAAGLQGQGIAIQNSTNDNATGILVRNCICNNCDQNAFTASLCEATFENCQTNYCMGNSFSQFLNGPTPTTTFYKNCSCKGSGMGAAFNVIAGSTDTGSIFNFENCTVTGGNTSFSAEVKYCNYFNCSAFNTQFGFNIINAINSVIENCTASSCANSGFNMQSCTTATVANCLATKCAIGFQNNSSTNAIFYGNTATNNSISYQGITSPPSAPQALFASATYGANLADVLP